MPVQCPVICIDFHWRLPSFIAATTLPGMSQLINQMGLQNFVSITGNWGQTKMSLIMFSNCYGVGDNMQSFSFVTDPINYPGTYPGLYYQKAATSHRVNSSSTTAWAR
jgi:hypothetical protein